MYLCDNESYLPNLNNLSNTKNWAHNLDIKSSFSDPFVTCRVSIIQIMHRCQLFTLHTATLPRFKKALLNDCGTMHETHRPSNPFDCRTIPTRSWCTLNLWIIVCKTFDISIIRSTEKKKTGRYYRRKEILDYSAIVGRNLSRHLYFNT